jgi:N-acetylmuramoyl-L-alanine amidase
MAAGCLAALLASCLAGTAFAQGSARARYETALARERATDPEAASLKTLRDIVAAYEAVVRRFPTSPYSDNALWQAAGVASDAYRRFGVEQDRTTAATLLRRLAAEYPSSSLVGRAVERRTQIEASAAERRPSPGHAVGDAVTAAATPAATTLSVPAGPARAGPALIRAIHRLAIPDGIRIVVELDAEVQYREERLLGPDRLFFDLENAQAAAHLLDAQLTFPDNMVRRIRLGRHQNNVTRVVLDVENVGRYSVARLSNPFRLVIDCTRPGGAQAAAVAPPAQVTAPTAGPAFAVDPPAAPGAATIAEALPASREAGPVPPQFALATEPSRVGGLPVPPEPKPEPASVRAEPAAAAKPETAAPAAPRTPPGSPSANTGGHFSIARQLGLGVSRIVIDPGHGGHDPGAQAQRLTESSLVLDIALRLEKLLVKEPGVEVVMTRRTDVFVPLEERTAMANRTGADLFLSIHANASRNARLGGVETYFLNFASNPAAEALAARENAVSGATMAKLPDIVRAIALNNKLDESRDFAAAVQNAMVKKLRSQHRGLRDLGVKQAPFVVLIGAGMPSVLAEVSFVTNRDEGRLLRGTSYRQKIAEALFEAIQRYQRSLKKVATVAEQ